MIILMNLIVNNQNQLILHSFLIIINDSQLLISIWITPFFQTSLFPCTNTTQMKWTITITAQNKEAATLQGLTAPDWVFVEQHTPISTMFFKNRANHWVWRWIHDCRELNQAGKENVAHRLLQLPHHEGGRFRNVARWGSVLEIGL